MNMALMKEMSDCNLAQLPDTHMNSNALLPFSLKNIGRWKHPLQQHKFSNLEKVAPPHFNEGEPQQRCSNDWIAYNMIPPPPGRCLCIHRKPSFSHHSAREGRENKRTSLMLTQ